MTSPLTTIFSSIPLRFKNCNLKKYRGNIEEIYILLKSFVLFKGKQMRSQIDLFVSESEFPSDVVPMGQYRT